MKKLFFLILLTVSSGLFAQGNSETNSQNKSTIDSLQRKIEKLEKSGERYKIDYLKRNYLLQMQNKITYITKRKSQLELFVEFSTILSIIVTIPSLFFYNNFLSKTQNILNPVLLSVIISIATGILITLISSIVSRIRARRSSDTEDINEFVNVDDENSNGPLYKP